MSNPRRWIWLCLAIFSCAACGLAWSLLRYSGTPPPAEDAIAKQYALATQGGCLVSESGTAIEYYAKAVGLIEQNGLTGDTLKKWKNSGEPIPDNARQVLREAVKLVEAGAARKHAGIEVVEALNPAMRFVVGENLNTQVKVGSKGIDMTAFILPAYACEIEAHLAFEAGDARGGMHMLEVLTAMGFHLRRTDESILHAASIACRQDAITGIRDEASSKGDTTLAQRCEEMLGDIRQEFDALKKSDSTR